MGWLPKLVISVIFCLSGDWIGSQNDTGVGYLSVQLVLKSSMNNEEIFFSEICF